ncbi:unnamed protein product [Choristocarpus tenellus]
MQGQIQVQQQRPRSSSASVAIARAAQLSKLKALAAFDEGACPQVKTKEGQGNEQNSVGTFPPASPVKKSVVKPRGPTLEDALLDVQVRFVLNLPEAEMSSADRLFFQLEQAWWFYEDFIADVHPHLPHFQLKEFAKLLFEYSEALKPLRGKYNELFEYFRSWKGTIPTAGCILLNKDMTKLVLVKSWKGKGRGLPKGKINQGETPSAAAVREVLEETGYNAEGMTSEKKSFTVYLNGQQSTMYIVTGVDENFKFEPQVRKEISAIEWFPLDALPKGAYGVDVFMTRLRRWMDKNVGDKAVKSKLHTTGVRTQSATHVRKGRGLESSLIPNNSGGESGAKFSPKVSSTKQRKNSKSGNKDVGGGGTERANSAPGRRGSTPARGYDVYNQDTFGGDEAGGGDATCSAQQQGWGFEAMLAANERLTGRTFVYDGNPHEFGDQPPPPPPAVATARAKGKALDITVVGETHVPCMTQPRAEDRVKRLKERVPLREVETVGTPTSAQVPKMDSERSLLKPEVTQQVQTKGLYEGLAPAVVALMGAAANAQPKGTRTKKVCSRPVMAPCVALSPGRQLQEACTEGRGGVSTCGEGSGGGGLGLFGEFKFDAMDIMKAVANS